MIQYWNTVIEYLSAKEQVEGTYDLTILAGNSLPYLADELVQLYKQGRTSKVMLVGGVGHATPFLAKNFEELGISVGATSEAEMYLTYFKERYGLSEEIFLTETRSKNSGENARFSLAKMREHDLAPERVLLLEDPILQRRLRATFEKEWRGFGSQFANAVPMIPYIKTIDDNLTFEAQQLNGLWTKDYFLSLVLGEIPRLRNDRNGYGPKGAGYIGSIEIPTEVLSAYEKLSTHYHYEYTR
ncbi:YdcF family protein [Enterococcus wangshanyuanii]|uniref:DUF218 domain-containing protein n=1 Tax=Enterococcus wangshanyuanii TaxID=2005703 RepID=A0ABQ1NTB1_9ENTE|nr:YdcF family protein [Enterococcus wangshanyuanii]GGC84639.1 hypothetical protein GCM10011573_12830 [Enterococcus wangshanyuanii]